MPQEQRPHALVEAPSSTPLVDERDAEQRDALIVDELIVDELLRAERAYWQRAGSVDAMLAMVL